MSRFITRLFLHRGCAYYYLRREDTIGRLPKVHAQALAAARQQGRAKPRIKPATWATVESLLRQQWSPEQISGWLKLERQEGVSHERIYQYIYADKRRAAHFICICVVRRR